MKGQVNRDGVLLSYFAGCDFQLWGSFDQGLGTHGFTDDASVVEAYLNDVQACNRNPSLWEGHRVGSITLVEGNRENIKITTPFDLLVAEAIVKLES